MGVISPWHDTREVIIRVSVFGWATLLAFHFIFHSKTNLLWHLSSNSFGCLKKTHLFCVKNLNLTHGNCSYLNDTVLLMRLFSRWLVTGWFQLISDPQKRPYKFRCYIGSNLEEQLPRSYIEGNWAIPGFSESFQTWSHSVPHIVSLMRSSSIAQEAAPHLPKRFIHLMDLVDAAAWGNCWV